jgi:hypothetical protein
MVLGSSSIYLAMAQFNIMRMNDWPNGACVKKAALKEMKYTQAHSISNLFIFKLFTKLRQD